MNSKYREALPLLKEKISFEVEDITSLDLFYNDGDSRVMKSFFKLVLPKAVAYIYEGGFWVSYGCLSEKESLTLYEWIKNA
jgi:hypothetical protein